MSVAALPARTVSAIGSAQALTDPASLVKELIDNAVDGRASSIAVDISADTLNDIRVKDNGHGIDPDDRSKVCLRHCTSKIRDLEELRTIGGRSLGFRGMALASVAEMSGCLMISTRIEGEETAVELRFDRQGHIAGEKRTSLPVGTTVRIERFLEAFPVRRQSAEKTSTKTLARIRGLLQAYAFARPYLRLSLRVLKAKDGKANWKYPLNARVRGLEESECRPLTAAIDIVGKKITDQCQYLTWSSTGDLSEKSSQDLDFSPSQETSYRFQAVLARPSCDCSIISHVGQYLSVDSRPVSCARGTFKQIVSSYKSHLRSVGTREEIEKIINPFLSINIVCPLGSYDINVEPAKDDVLFTDAGLVLCLVEKFFDSVYGESESRRSVVPGPENISNPRGIELMLARKKASVEPVSGAEPENSVTAAASESGKYASNETTTHSRSLSPSKSDINHKSSSFKNSRPWKSSMYDEDDSDNVPNVSGSDDISDEEDDLKSVQVSNPWAFAKLNASFRAHGQRHRDAEANGNGSHQLPTPRRQAGDVVDSVRSSSSAFGDASPRRSDSPPHDRVQRRSVDESSSSPPSTSFPYPLKARGQPKAAERIERSATGNHGVSARGSLDAWVQKPYVGPLEDDNPSDNHDSVGVVQGPADVAPESFVSARALLVGNAFGNIAAEGRSERQKFPQKRQHQSHGSPVAPVNDLEKVWFDVGEKSKRKRSQHINPKRQQPIPGSLFLGESENGESSISSPAEGSTPSMHPDLAITLDYEARKQLATQQHREQLRRQALAENRNLQSIAGKPTVSKSSPHSNRQRAAIAALHIGDEPSASAESPSIFDPNDPRAYLIRTSLLDEKENQKPFEQRKALRKKTNLLPFETLLSRDYIGDLIQVLDTRAIDSDRLLNQGSTHDEYVREGIVAEAFMTRTTSQVQNWEDALKKMVKMQYRIEGMSAEEDMEGELDCDLSSLLQKLEAAEVV